MASNDQPRWTQLIKMIPFCHAYKYLYIWGTADAQRKVEKYLRMSDIQVSGYIRTENRKSMIPWWWQDGREDCEKNIKEDEYLFTEVLEKHPNREEIGILVAEEDMYLNDIISRIEEEKIPFKQVYFLSEYNKRTIAYKMTARPVERMWIEVNLADHCNLNCQMCDHFSPLAKPTFSDLQEYSRDIARLAELTGGRMGIMKLQGGEPLMNDDLLDYIKVTRKTFSDCVIYLFTNGLLLKKWEHHKKGNLWEVCHDCNVRIQLTTYPIGLDIEGIKELGRKYDATLDIFSEVGNRTSQEVKKSCKHPFRLQGDVEKWQFISCYQFNESITLSHGKLYTCPMIPYIHHFNTYFDQNLTVSKNDYIDIYQAKSYEELAEFVTQRTDFCRYCDVVSRRRGEWKQSKHDIGEYVDAEEEWKQINIVNIAKNMDI